MRSPPSSVQPTRTDNHRNHLTVTHWSRNYHAVTSLSAIPGDVAAPLRGTPRPAHRLRPPARITLVTALLVPACLAAAALPPRVVPAGMVQPTWWALAGLFYLTDVWLVRLPLRGRDRTLRLDALPLALGLLALGPGWLVLARVTGRAAGVVTERRGATRGALLDVAAAGAATAAATATFHPLVGGATVLSPRAWVAAGAALLVGVAAEALALVLAGVQAPPPLRGPGLLRVGGHAVGVRMLAGIPGALLALVLSFGSETVLPLVLAGVVAALGYRVRLSRAYRAQDLDRLLRFTAAVREARDADAVARAVVSGCVPLLGARHVELVVARRGAPAGRSWRCWAEGGLACAGVELAEVEALLATPARLVGLGDGDGVDRMLAARFLREALVVHLPVGDGMIAALLVGLPAVDGRRPRWTHDVRLVHAVANQATVALRHVHALERLRHDALHDALTGLPNRTEFRARAVEAIQGAASGLVPCAIGVLDLDGFKTVNDSLGHLAGDQVLAEVGRRMARLVEEGLVVSRLGGDEFAVLVPGVPDEQHLVALARRLLEGLHEPFTVDNEQVRLTGSLGLALGPRDGLTADQLLRNADIAMYAAKAEAGGLRVYTRTLSDSVDAPLSLAADLRLALARGDLTIAVQPLVDLSSGKLHSVEALARWRHPMLGPVNPEAFVLAAERGGLVGELTDQVVDQALRACRSWLDLGLEVQVAVNLAARLLADPDLPDGVERALRRHGLPGRLLCLELTETGVITNPERALVVLGRLRELGVKVAVDDFGTGYSSMTYMKWLSPDQVKIDKTFVQRLRFEPRNQAIVRSIIELGRNLGIDVVAEGVGDPRTATVLSDFGCTLGQGFLFAEPMVPCDLPDWVTSWMAVPEREELGEPEARTGPYGGVPTPAGYLGGAARGGSGPARAAQSGPRNAGGVRAPALRAVQRNAAARLPPPVPAVPSGVIPTPTAVAVVPLDPTGSAALG